MSDSRDPRSGGFDRRKHEELARLGPQSYAQAVQEVAEFGIYLLDDQGLIQSWNHGASNLTGYSEAEVLGQPFDFLFNAAAVADKLPQQTLEFARANRHHRDEQARRKKNGEPLMALCTLDAIRDDSGRVLAYVEVFSDITRQKEREAALYQRATRDALTGLANRGHFTEMASLEIERARRFNDPLSIALLDLDFFKRVNDNYGHDAGDLALITFAKVCQEMTRKIDLVGRIGGEEVAILLPRANKEPAYEMLQRLRLRLMECPVRTNDGKEFGLTVSIGLASLNPDIRDLRELLRNADAALYRAKREGRNRVEAWFE
jgi:diguanylate cyclase (GGDEF)-like protein/PAS domain S-box-containing protein